MFRYDPQHTGRSPFLGAQTPDLEWEFRTGDPNWWVSSPAIGSDGTVYVGAAPALYAIGGTGLPHIVDIMRAVFFNHFSLPFVSANSSTTPNPQLAVTVPSCTAVTQVPMTPLQGGKYVFLQKVTSCGNLDGQIVTVTSSLGGSDTETIR
jgi:hypothetical protein